MPEAFLVDGVRTPVGRYGAGLAGVRADDLAARVIGSLVERTGLDPERIDDIVMGAANQAGEDNRNVARMGALLAGLPPTVPGYTVNRLCASGLQAVASAAASIRSGAADIILAGGAESMTRAPWVMAKPGTPWAKPGEVADTALGWRLVNPRMRSLDGGDATLSLGECTEKLAAEFSIARADCDAYAARSQACAAAAWEQGFFSAEVVPVERPGAEPLTRDETVRASSVESLGALRPSFRPDGVVTAGNASPLSDGASAIAVVSEEALRQHGLTPRARVVAATVAGVEPSRFGFGPVPAIQSLLTRTGMTLDQIDVIEINEAFAAQVLVCQQALGIEDSRLNPDGGAIALGHPLGSSGARILITMLGHLERTGGRYGIASLCIGVGQGSAMLIERL